MTESNQKVLMVGAGGIGCELLKNLVLTGFSDIDVIDLDTIELSNLNRQFLFQKCHVGKPKAIVARESVLRFNPNVNITAYHDSIFSPKYNVDYFKQFAIVLSALDNKSARSHLNRLCLAADVPLVESGSSGYLGQITLIKKDLTECYDCLPKPPAKTFPGCTIRNTPSEPIHCIVWAKHLFNQLFGSEDPDEAVSPDGEDPENMANAGELAVNKSTNEDIVVRVSTRQWAKNTNYEPGKLFNKLFNEDIKYLLSMSKLWEKRKAPTPLDWSQCLSDHTIMGSGTATENGNGAESATTASSSSKQQQAAEQLSSHKIWTMSECCDVLRKSVSDLHKRLQESADESSGQQILCWDKDDEDAMNFVASAANLRCAIFSIPIKSKFEIKSLAGNIIPAIATTNAMVAGLVVIQALKVLRSKLDECRTVYIRDKPSQNKLIVSSELVKPNPKCYVCASKPEVSVKLNTTKFTIKQFETKVLKQELNMIQPDVEIDDGTGRIIISSEEGETEENNDKTLSHFGLTNQSRLKCDDFFQNFEIRITLYHTDELDPQNVKEYEILSDDQTLKDIQVKQQESALREEELKRQTAAAAASDEPDLLIEVLDHEKKRKYEVAAFVGDEDDKLLAAQNMSQRKRFKSSEQQRDHEIITNNNSNNTNNNNQDDSGSIDDASDALSEDDEQIGVATNGNGSTTTTTTTTRPPTSEISTNGDYNSQSASYQFGNTRRNDVIQEEDEDCIIEEEEEEEEVANVSKKLKTNHAAADDDDDDIIECSDESEQPPINNNINGNHHHQEEEDSDIIEINEEKSMASGAGGSTNGCEASESNSNNLTSPNVSDEPIPTNDEESSASVAASKTIDQENFSSSSSEGVTIIE